MRAARGTRYPRGSTSRFYNLKSAVEAAKHTKTIWNSSSKYWETAARSLHGSKALERIHLDSMSMRNIKPILGAFKTKANPVSIPMKAFVPSTNTSRAVMTMVAPASFASFVQTRESSTGIATYSKNNTLVQKRNASTTSNYPN
jgi:hypothetical protein